MLTRLEEEEEEMAEDKVNFDVMKALEVAKKYMCQFDNKHSIGTMCNKLEKELQTEIQSKERINSTKWIIK